MRSILVLILIILVAGCGNMDTNTNGERPLVGYVVKKESDRILVVSVDPIQQNNHEAVWVRTSEHLLIGQMVEVLFQNNEIKSSYPGQGTAKSIKTIKIETSGNPRRTGEEVLREAIHQRMEWEIPVITELKFVREQQKWSVKMVDGRHMTEEEQLWLDD